MTEASKKFAGASYIVLFFQEVATLTHNAALYNNLLVEMQNKKTNRDANDSPVMLTEIETSTIQELNKVLRGGVYKATIQYKALLKSLNREPPSNLEGLINNIYNNALIPRKDLEDFIIILNEFFVEEIIQHFLESSTSLLQEYSRDNERYQTEPAADQD